MKLRILTVLAASAVASTAFAGSGNWFESVDANADGYLSAAELGEKKAHKIQKLDTNGDDLISRDEYDAYKAKKRAEKDGTA